MEIVQESAPHRSTLIDQAIMQRISAGVGRGLSDAVTLGISNKFAGLRLRQTLYRLAALTVQGAYDGSPQRIVERAALDVAMGMHSDALSDLVEMIGTDPHSRKRQYFGLPYLPGETLAVDPAQWTPDIWQAARAMLYAAECDRDWADDDGFIA